MAQNQIRPKSPPDLTIVLPAYREERRIAASLEQLAEFLQTSEFFKSKMVEVIVVSADSPDKTREIVAAHRHLFPVFQFVQPGPHVGKGRDVRAGMLQAHGRIVAYMDADLATPLHHLEAFYRECEAGSDVVIGTRNLRRHHRGWFRTAISTGGNVLFRLAGGVWIEDSQCGFKMFSERANRLCFSRMTILRWGFDMEVLAIAHVNGLRIACQRIDDWQDKPFSTFSDAVVKNSLHSLKDLAHIVRNRIKGVYLEKGGKQA